jgi:hypothetical protein
MFENLLRLAGSYDACDTFGEGGREAEPLRCLLSDINNRIHEARNLGDDALVEELEAEWWKQFVRYRRTEARLDASGYSEKMAESGHEYACGRPQRALPLDEEAYQIAVASAAADPSSHLWRRRQAIAASNLCSVERALAQLTDDEAERQSRLESAVRWGETSLQHDRKDPISVVELAMAVDDAGDAETADRLLQAILPAANFGDPKNALAVRIRFEPDLLMRDHLTAVRTMLERLAD